MESKDARLDMLSDNDALAVDLAFSLERYFKRRNINKWRIGSVGSIDQGKLSNFQQVIRLNARAGNRVGTPSWQRLLTQFKVVQEEFNEMSNGVLNFDVVEMADGAIDTLVTVYGLLWLAGIDADQLFSDTMSCLMTRIDDSYEAAKKTQEYYASLGLETEIRDNTSIVDGKEKMSFAVVSAKDQLGPDNKMYPAGKWLKSIYSKPVVTSELIPLDVQEVLGDDGK